MSIYNKKENYTLNYKQKNTMKIKKVVCSAGKTGFFFDDQKAIKAGAKNDGNFYVGDPMTPGFTSVRQMGESISVCSFSKTDR